MPSNQTENYLRLHLLNNEAIEVLRATFLKIVEETCCGDVDKFLSEFEQDIKKQLKNQAQRCVLFPANGRTDVEKWDVSLLCFILISCCTLEGKICIEKLRDLMGIQISVHSDIDQYLAYYKEEIDQMKRNFVINQAQYEKLYPKNSKSNLYGWDLNMLLSIIAQFCRGQNKVKFREILRNCIRRDIGLHLTTPDLAEYLKLKERNCKEMCKNGIIQQEQYNQLFPENDGISDVNNWDDHLLEMFVSNICVGLKQDTVVAIKVVKQVRNEMLAHKGSAEMETGEFLKTWSKLYNSIEVIVKEEVLQLAQEWTQKCEALNRDPFDISGAISILIEYYSNETSKFNSVRDAIQEIHDTMKTENAHRVEEHRCIQEQLTQLQKVQADMAEALQNLVGEKKDTSRYTITIDVECIEVKIHIASANESSKENTERAIRSSIHAALKGKQTEIKIQTVSNLLGGITKDGSKVESVERGSILLNIKCFSIKGIIKLMLHMGSQELRNTMKELEEEIGDEVEIGCDISDESKQSIMQQLARIQNNYDVMKPLVCSSIDQDNEKTKQPIYQAVDNEDSEKQLVYLDTKETDYKTQDRLTTDQEKSSDLKIPVFEKIKTFDVKCPDDVEECVITSCTSLPTGLFALCDASNKNIKLYDKHYTFRSMVRFPNYPFDSCMSDNDNTEMLVTVPLKGFIYRITAVDNEITKKGAICLYNHVYGITCCALGIAVVVFDQNWEVLLLQHDGLITKRFRFASSHPMEDIEPSYITSIADGNQLIISDDRSQSLRSVHVHTGEMVSEYKDEDLVYPGRVTSDDQGNIYVEDSGSNAVRMISFLEEKVGDILTDVDGLVGPTGLEYNQFNDTIMLQPNWNENIMCVYRLFR